MSPDVNAASSFQKYLAPISCFWGHNVNTAVDLHVNFLYSQGADSSPDSTPGLDSESYKPSGWLFCFSSRGCPFQKGEDRDLCAAWHFSLFSVAVIKNILTKSSFGGGDYFELQVMVYH